MRTKYKKYYIKENSIFSRLPLVVVGFKAGSSWSRDEDGKGFDSYHTEVATAPVLPKSIMGMDGRLSVEDSETSKAIIRNAVFVSDEAFERIKKTPPLYDKALSKALEVCLEKGKITPEDGVVANTVKSIYYTEFVPTPYSWDNCLERAQFPDIILDCGFEWTPSSVLKRYAGWGYIKANGTNFAMSLIAEDGFIHEGVVRGNIVKDEEDHYHYYFHVDEDDGKDVVEIVGFRNLKLIKGSLG